MPAVLEEVRFGAVGQDSLLPCLLKIVAGLLEVRCRSASADAALIDRIEAARPSPSISGGRQAGLHTDVPDSNVPVIDRVAFELGVVRAATGEGGGIGRSRVRAQVGHSFFGGGAPEG